MPLAPLATPADVEDRLGRDLTAEESLRLLALLEGASAAFRIAAGGQQIAEATSTARLKVRNGKVRLPQRPVSTVSAVVDTNGNAVSFDYVMGDTVTVAVQVPDAWAWEPYRNGLQAVDVTYTHGFAEVPDDVVEVVCQMAARALGRPADQSGVTQTSLGDASQSFGPAGSAGAVGMLADERAVARAYARPASSSHAFS